MPLMDYKSPHVLRAPEQIRESSNPFFTTTNSEIGTSVRCPKEFDAPPVMSSSRRFVVGAFGSIPWVKQNSGTESQAGVSAQNETSLSKSDASSSPGKTEELVVIGSTESTLLGVVVVSNRLDIDDAAAVLVESYQQEAGGATTSAALRSVAAILARIVHPVRPAVGTGSPGQPIIRLP